MKKESAALTISAVLAAHDIRRDEIRRRLAEFGEIWHGGDNEVLWRELVFCIFTANASARMGLRSVEACRNCLASGTREELAAVLRGVHRFPNARAGYIVHTREFLGDDCRLDLRTRLNDFTDDLARRDWLAQTKGIKGLGYKEASHFLRNVGFRGYAILDKHILNSLVELDVIESAKPPANRKQYLEAESRLRRFADQIEVDFDELDLVLWSLKTGEVLK